jgi:hypothetical protein
MRKERHGFGTVFVTNFFHPRGNVFEGFIPAGLPENLLAAFFHTDEGCFQTIFVVIHANTASTTGTQTSVAVLIFFVAYNLPDPALCVFINPACTFPETNLTVSGSPGKVYLEGGSLCRFGKCPGSVYKASADGQGTCAYRGNPDEIPAVRHAINEFILQIKIKKNQKISRNIHY